MPETEEIHDPAQENRELLKRSGFASQQQNANILAVTPYTKGLGFSVKKTYPDDIRQSFQVENRDKIFAFISLAAYKPNKRSKSGLGLAFLEVTAAKTQSGYAADGAVVPLHDDGKQLPMSLTESYHIDFDTRLLYLVENPTSKSINLETAFENLWEEHLSTFSKVNRPWIQFQVHLRKSFQRRFLCLLKTIEILTWVIGGQTFKASIPADAETETNNSHSKFSPKKEDNQKKNEWIFQWLERENFFSYTNKSNIFPRIDIDYSSQKVAFHGITVTPIAVLWFYILVLAFYLYRNLESPIGGMQFLNAYWYAILFFAPITVLILSTLIPACAKHMMNWLADNHRKADAGIFSSVSLKPIFGLVFLIRKSKFHFDNDNYDW